MVKINITVEERSTRHYFCDIDGCSGEVIFDNEIVIRNITDGYNNFIIMQKDFIHKCNKCGKKYRFVERVCPVTIVKYK